MLSFFLCCICICIVLNESYLDTLYTASDEDYLSSIIGTSQDSSTGLFEKSLTTTYYATQALSVSNNDIQNGDKLCSTLKSYKISSWEEFHNLLLSRSRIKNCLDSIKDASQKKLSDGLSANKLSKVYYSINGIYTLAKTKSNLYDTSSLDIVEILKHIQSFQLNNKLFTEQIKSSKSKSSIHKTSMALYATAKLLSLPNLTLEQQKEMKESAEMTQLLASFVETANVLMTSYSKLNENMISYSNSLTATSVVLESINEFLQSLLSMNELKHFAQQFDKFNDKQYVENILRYILTFRSTTSPTSARHVIILMNMVKSSVLFDISRPISIEIENKIFNQNADAHKEENALTISIRNVFGEQMLAANENTRIEIVSCVEIANKQKQGPIGSFIKEKGNTYSYSYPFGEEIRKLSSDESNAGINIHGIYSLKITVNDDNFGKELTISTLVKVTTFISKTVFGMQYVKKSQDGYSRVTHPKQLSESYDVTPSQKVKIEIQVKSAKKANQIIIDFVDDKNGESVLQIVPKTRQEKYGITIDLSRGLFSVLSGGKYRLNLIVGDPLYSESLTWNNIVAINCIEEEEDESDVDYEPINDEIPKWRAKEKISHTFGNAEREPIILFPLIFCIILLFPLLYFFNYVFITTGTSITFGRDVQLSSGLFIVSLSAIVAILFLYWWQWNIFEAGGWLFIACIAAFLFGYNVLKNHLEIRTKGKRKKENKLN